MEFSAQQQRAIGARGKNLLVSAAAGSGKTTVLVERVLGLIREGVNIDEILIVTFTRAASGDMRQKFYRRLSEEAEKGDKRMYEQLERLEFSSISTLHAFCTRVIRQNFELADVDPGFRILTKAEEDLITERELTNLLEEAYGRRDEGFMALAFGRNDAKLREMILSLQTFLSARPDREAWFGGFLNLLHSDGAIWKDVLSQSAASLLKEAVLYGEQALALCGMPGGPMEQYDAIEKELSQISAAIGLDYEGLQNAAACFKGERARSKSKGGEGDAELAASVKKLRDRMKKLLTEKVRNLVSLPLEIALSDLRDDEKAVRALYEMTVDLDARLQKAKKEKGALTFNDLEHLMLKLIRDESVRTRLKEKYKYIFLDEYQDTSDIQEAIVEAIAGENNRFMVGDVKQSIYRFRNAVPELFMDKYRTYAEGGQNELIVLGENYRSRLSVLEFVNLLFERVMSGGESEIVYDENARLHQGKKDFEGADAPVEILLVDKSGVPEETEEDAEKEEREESEEDDDNPDPGELKDAEREALLIADRIHSLMEADKTLRYRDFCVITRKKKNVSASMAAILAANSIPSYADETESTFDALEVSVILNVLKLLLNRRRETELLSVLRSPMFFLKTNDLARLRISVPDGPLFSALAVNADQIEGVRRFLDLYARWKLVMRSLPINALIRRIAEDTGYYSFVGALPGGRHRQANIDMLCELARAYEQTQGRSLSGFLEHMTHMKNVDDGSGAHELGENDDVVRLMTAHKSKGLEFKVVFAAMLGTAYSSKPAGGAILTDKLLGVGFEHIDRERMTVRSTLITRAIREYRKRKELAEELRVLYVTLTRAQERLILTGTVRDFSQSLVDWRIAQIQPSLYKSALDIAMSAVIGCPGCELLGGQTKMQKPQVNLRVCAAPGVVPKTSGGSESMLERVDDLLQSELWDEDTYNAYRWHYPELNRPYAPLKLAVTGLEKEFTGGGELGRIKTEPGFISGRDGNVYTKRGTAVHIALQNLDYDPLRGERDYARVSMEVARQLNRMADQKLLLPAERELVRPAMIADFVLSPLGQRVLNAPYFKREWSFTLFMPTERVIPGYPAGERLIVQGTIDLCFLEEDEWVLVDYKTDRAADDGEIISRYGTQIDVYAEALQALTGKKVKQAILCLVRDGRTIEIQPKIWNKQER